MKKVLIYVSCAIVLLGIGFFFGFCLGSDERQAPKEETELVVEDENPLSEVEHELKSQPDIKRLASMMLEEKRTQHLNEALYVSYLVDSLGFVMDDRYDSRRWWNPESKLFVGGGMTLTLCSKMREDGQPSRYIQIKGGSTGGFIQDLKQFGLKYEEGEDGFCEYGGNGLYAGTSPNSIQFGF